MLAGMIERLSASMEAVLILCTVGFLKLGSRATFFSFAIDKIPLSS